MIKVGNKSLWIFGGTLSIIMAIVGAILPILPVTPFLILAAYCYGRGSDRFSRWMMDRPWIGGYIRAYREFRGIPLKQKILAIILIWLTIGLTIWTVGLDWRLELMLAGIAASVTLQLTLLKTWRPTSPVQIEFKPSFERIETKT
jgi:uncharacterized protein